MSARRRVGPWRRGCGIALLAGFAAFVGVGALFAVGLRRAARLSDDARDAALAWTPTVPGRTVLIVDFTLPSFVPRAHLYDRETGDDEAFFVTHGSGSGWAWVATVSNVPESHQSSAGALRAGEIYQGAHGRSLRLEGLEPGVNDAAMARDIVIHGADYAAPESILWNYGRLGRSSGCLAFSPEVAQRVIDRLAGGGLVYVYFTPPTAPGTAPP